MAAGPLLRDRLSFLHRLPVLLKGTSDDEAPCPGYLFEEIAKISHESLGSSQCLLEYLLSRLQSGSGHVKLKVLKILRYLCSHGSSSFLLILQCNSALIQEAAGSGLHMPSWGAPWASGVGRDVESLSSWGRFQPVLFIGAHSAPTPSGLAHCSCVTSARPRACVPFLMLCPARMFLLDLSIPAASLGLLLSFLLLPGLLYPWGCCFFCLHLSVPSLTVAELLLPPVCALLGHGKHWTSLVPRARPRVARTRPVRHPSSLPWAFSSPQGCSSEPQTEGVPPEGLWEDEPGRPSGEGAPGLSRSEQQALRGPRILFMATACTRRIWGAPCSLTPCLCRPPAGRPGPCHPQAWAPRPDLRAPSKASATARRGAAWVSSVLCPLGREGSPRGLVWGAQPLAAQREFPSSPFPGSAWRGHSVLPAEVGAGLGECSVGTAGSRFSGGRAPWHRETACLCRLVGASAGLAPGGALLPHPSPETLPSPRPHPQGAGSGRGSPQHL
ncbi:AP-4 complex accessory subunit tepsin isoform X4 [Choloepus didactylus]|uniref:AP-4 complex accessory subunit tepsin isoform X4 n=1 Tax=Choloepus didactylus TaxID=27675 RepID=UPI00189CDC66|nr:AP-4 complex accessory subunit tepsin isoform X4 [Choloepus didactylus]